MYAHIGIHVGLRVHYEDDRFLFLGDRHTTEEI